MKCNFLFAIALLLLSAPPPARAQVSFSNPASYPVGTAPVAVATGDFNADGKLDVVVANSGSNNVSILLGNGDGTFGATTNFSVGGLNPVFIAVGDFNQDHHEDLAVANFGDVSTGQGAGVSVLLGSGDGTFQSARTLSTDGLPTSVAIGDFDGDGKRDLAVTQGPGASPMVAVLLGNGDGTFQQGVDYSLEFPANSAAVGDLNGDHKPDLVIATGGVGEFSCCDVESKGAVSVLIGTGDGTFQPAVNYSVSDQEALSVALGDFNGDGKMDLATATTLFIHKEFQKLSYTASESVLLGNGDGTFQPTFSFDLASFNYAVFITSGDLNSDGNVDLAVLDRAGVGSGVSLRLLLGNGDGGFQTAVVFDGDSATSLALADFNRDGRPDLVLTNSVDNTIGVLLSSGGTSGFTLAVSAAGTGSGTVTSGPSGINCGNICSSNFTDGTMVVLTAATAAGSSFAGWSGAGCSGTGICSVTMNANESVTATFSLVVAPSFSISAASDVNISSPGQSASTTIMVAPNGGFIGTVMLSCTPDANANESGCSFTVGSTSGSTVQVNLNSSSVDVTFNVTTAPHMVAALPMVPSGTSGRLAGSALLILLIPIVYRRRRALLGFAALACLLILGACGGGGGNNGNGHTDPGTAPGNYTFTVTGTSGSGSGAATVSTLVAVKVQ